MKKQMIPAFSPDLAENGGGKQAKPIVPGGKDRRTKSKIRRKIDPPIDEHSSADDQAELVTAMDHYKLDNRRPFPTWSEVLEVLQALGYRRVAEPTKMPAPSIGTQPKTKA
jgi:hypothetical protein